MRHPLDRPVWTALTTRHSPLARGGPLAKRYPPTIVPFAASADSSAESLRALEELVPPGDTVVMPEADDIALPPGLAAVSIVKGVQMIADDQLQRVSDERIQRLTEADAAEMLALATLTKPGPFTLQAMSLGEFWGVKIDGRLAVMAGERMKQPGYTELSGVCSHPDFRGGGLGRLLSLHVAGKILKRGEIPYLHAYATNETAIRLYESIGFKLRSSMNIAVVQRRS
jgi:predicted GNAT family acetyltransferase